MNREYFNIPIGDWSNDGHGRYEWFRASTAKSLADVREAYFKAKDLLPVELAPEKICESHQGTTVPVSLALEIFRRSGIRIDGSDSTDFLDFEKVREIVGDDELDVSLDKFVDYLVWFINFGDPTADVKLELPVEMLPFYGFDTKRRHIPHIGYGLVSY
jgi:hypothetical protein